MLVSELDPNQPQVLIISQDEWWGRRLRQTLERRRLDVTTVPIWKVVDQPDVLRQRSWYKVVLLADSFDYSSEAALAQHLTQLEQFFNASLQPGGPLVVVVRTVTPITTQLPETAGWRQRSRADHAILTLLNISLAPSGLTGTGRPPLSGPDRLGLVIVVENLVPPESAGWLPLQYSIQRLDQQLLLDPDITFPLTSAGAAINEVTAAILAPQSPARIVVAGRPRPSSSLVQEVARHYFHLSGKRLKRQRFALETAEPMWSDWQLQRLATPSLPDLLTPSVRLLPQDEDRLAEFLKHIRPVGPAQLIGNTIQEVVNISPHSPHSPHSSRSAVNRRPGDRHSDDRHHPARPSQAVPPPAAPAAPDTTQLGSPHSPSTAYQSFDTTIESLFSQHRFGHKLERVVQLAQQTKQTRRRSGKRRVMFWLGAVVVGLGLAAVSALAVFIVSIGLLRRAIWNELDSPPPSARLTRQLGFVQWQYQLYRPLLPPSLWGDVPTLIGLARELSALPEIADRFNRHRSEVVTGLMGAGASQALNGQNGVFNAKTDYTQLSDIISRFKDIGPPNDTLRTQTDASQLITAVNQLRGGLVLYQQLEPNLPQLLAFENKKIYGVIVQNNQELRPGGGLVEAVGVITLEGGRVIDARTWSVRQLEQQFSGQVAPPPELASLLGLSNWQLRDANWSADFRQAGRQLTFFLEQSLQQEVAGVIGLNQRSLSEVLTALGPLEIARLNQTVTADNLAERWYQHTQSTSQPNVFAEAVTAALLEAIQQLDDQAALDLLGALHQALRSQQLTVYLVDPNLEATISALGWSGEVVAPECPARLATVNCVVDSIAVVEANVGVNKANHLTTRRDTHTIHLSPTSARHTRQLLLNNDSSANAWPQGVYRAYITALLPRGAEEIEIEIDDHALSSNQLRLTVGETHTELNFLTTVPLNSKRQITLRYTIPLDDIAPAQPFSYVFFNQQQPGTEQVLSSVTLVHGPPISPTLIIPAADVEADTLFFHDVPGGHSLVGGQFQPRE